MLTPEEDAQLNAYCGHWEVEGDLYWVERAPEGGLMGTICWSGEEISPAWVILRGRFVDAECVRHSS